MNKKICVVGAGRWGKNHIKTLHGLGFLAGIVEASADVRAEFKEKYPEVKTFATVREAIKEDFDGFTVATPAETHFKIAEFIITRQKTRPRRKAPDTQGIGSKASQGTCRRKRRKPDGRPPPAFPPRNSKN